MIASRPCGASRTAGKPHGIALNMDYTGCGKKSQLLAHYKGSKGRLFPSVLRWSHFARDKHFSMPRPKLRPPVCQSGSCSELPQAQDSKHMRTSTKKAHPCRLADQDGRDGEKRARQSCLINGTLFPVESGIDRFSLASPGKTPRAQPQPLGAIQTSVQPSTRALFLP